MSKVLIDRELLERWADKLEGADSAGYGWEDLLEAEIRGAIAQPAEAEGVEVVAYATPNEDGDWQMLFFDEKEAIQYVDDESPAPLVLQSAHIAALSAVTAERDRLDADWDRLDADCGRLLEEKIQEAETIFLLEAERDQLRSEVETLKKDAERYRWIARQLDAWSVLGEFYGLPSEHEGVADLSEAIDAAMAAKEA